MTHYPLWGRTLSARFSETRPDLARLWGFCYHSPDFVQPTLLSVEVELHSTRLSLRSGICSMTPRSTRRRARYCWTSQPWHPVHIWLALALAACCGCQLIGHERPVSKQLAQSRQESQRGISALDRGDWQGGETLLAQSIKLCPVDPEPHFHYAEALWHRGAKQDALAEMQEALRLSGEDPALAVRTGEMCLDLGRLDDAARLADEAVDLDPRLATAWALRGEVAQAQGRLDDALAQLHRALEFQRDNKLVLLLIAEVYRQQNRPDRALNTLQTLRDGYNPGEEPQRVLYLEGLAFSALQRYDDAVDAYTLALERDRPAAELYYQLAAAHLSAGRPREAGQAVSAALALEPGHQPSRELAGRIDLALRTPLAESIQR